MNKYVIKFYTYISQLNKEFPIGKCEYCHEPLECEIEFEMNKYKDYGQIRYEIIREGEN